MSLSPHSITKLLAFLSYIGYFKDSTQHWSILMLWELLKYLWKYDFEAVFAQYCEYLKLLLLKCLVLCKFQLNRDICLHVCAVKKCLCVHVCGLSHRQSCSTEHSLWALKCCRFLRHTLESRHWMYNECCWLLCALPSLASHGLTWFTAKQYFTFPGKMVSCRHYSAAVTHYQIGSSGDTRLGPAQWGNEIDIHLKHPWIL